MPSSETKTDVYSKLDAIPTTIAIYGAPNSTRPDDNQKLDEIDASCQESFTLEEMRILLLSYRKKNKDFLIARVTTQDVVDSSVFYNFYYAASEINRILFRYETSRHLLHRMKVKNPLNNMYIMGQVYYYKVTPYEVDRGIVEYFFDTKKQLTRPKKAFSAVFRKKHDFFPNDKKSKSKDSMDMVELIEQGDSKEANPKKIIEEINKKHIAVPEIHDKKKKIQYRAMYFASDDDFLIKQETREYFRRNALEPDDDFLYDLDRTHNDLMALLDEDSQEEDMESVSDWRRVLSAHFSFALVLLLMCLAMGGLGILIFLPLAIFILLSFLISLSYVLCCRRTTFDTIAVNSIEDEL